MKITLEQADLPETEIIIRGDVSGPEAIAIVQLLRKKTAGGKLLLYKEDEQHIIDPKEIVYLETCGSKVSVYTRGDTFEAKLKLYELKEMLAPFSFAQISKSTLVNMDCVKSIQAEFSGNYRIKLKNRKEVLSLSRKYFKEFKERI